MPSFRYSHTVGFYAQSGRGFNNPVDVALGRNGKMFVADRADSDVQVRMPYKRITVCSVDEEYFGRFSTGGTGDGQILWPVSIALDEDENLYVLDEALNRVTVFDNDWNFVYKWGTEGSGDGEFRRPAGMAFDPDGNLVLADALNNRVQRYTADGQFRGSFGETGTRDGQFNLPWGVAVDRRGNVYVADWRNDRIQKFDPMGGHLATWGGPGTGDGEFQRPSGVTVDVDGLVYVADWGNERVQVLDPDGGFLAKFRGEAGVSKWGMDYFTTNQDELEERQRANMEPVLDDWAKDIPAEQSASIEKLFWGPTSVKIDDQGRIYVVDTCRCRIQVYVKEP